MKSFVGQLIQTAKVFVIFVGFTILFYVGMVWLNQEYEGYNRYDEPEGTALKVSSQTDVENVMWFERLKLFYWNGE